MAGTLWWSNMAIHGNGELHDWFIYRLCSLCLIMQILHCHALQDQRLGRNTRVFNLLRLEETALRICESFKYTSWIRGGTSELFLSRIILFKTWSWSCPDSIHLKVCANWIPIGFPHVYHISTVYLIPLGLSWFITLHQLLVQFITLWY